MTIQGVTGAIPTEWTMIIREVQNVRLSQVERTEIMMVANKTNIELAKCKCRHFYNNLIESNEPTAVTRWAYYGVRPQCWREIYEVPYKCTISTRLQSLHFRIINRYIPTRKYLCTRGVIGIPLCRKCFEVDDFKHFLYECADVKPFWKQILNQLVDKFKLPSDFNVYESVLLGYPTAPPIVNLILLLTKQYIVTIKLNTNDTTHEPQISCLTELISRYAQAELIIAKQQKTLERYKVKWGLIMDESGNVTIG